MKLVDRSADAKEAPHIVETLTKVIQEFLAQLDYTKTASEANAVAMRRRPFDLRKAFSVYCASQLAQEPTVTIDNPLARYVYLADVFKDAYDIMFGYLGEVEHTFGPNWKEHLRSQYTSDLFSTLLTELYVTDELWKEDFLLAHCEYIA